MIEHSNASRLPTVFGVGCARIGRGSEKSGKGGSGPLDKAVFGRTSSSSVISTMSIYALLSVAAGAVLGAWLRLWLGNQFNPMFPTLPFGTLTANLVGAYIIGLAIEYISARATLPPEVRLFVITGFCGSLTTFSTFSAELVGLLYEHRYAWGLAHIASHLFGSVVMTVLGMLTMRELQA